MKRNNISGRKIAKQRNVTPGFISKTLKEANNRIESLLEYSARANKITPELISKELGFIKGKSHMFNCTAFITFSPENGVQVWYDHIGDCVSCDEFTHCKTILLQEFKERNIRLENPQMRPTDMGKLLFKTLEEMVK